MSDTKIESELAPAKREKRLPALVVSRGIGIGKIMFLHGTKRPFFRKSIQTEQLNTEVKRFLSGVDVAKMQLRELAADTRRGGQPVLDMLDVQLLILESSFAEKVVTFIETERVNAEWAIQTVADQFVQQMNGTQGLRFKDKQHDIEDVANRILNALDGTQTFTHLEPGTVIVARYLSPSTIVEAAKNFPAAIITEQSGWTSHSSILAREFNIPMVSGVRNLRRSVADGDLVIVDALNGEVIFNPNETTKSEFDSIRSKNKDAAVRQKRVSGSASTADDAPFVIMANIDQPEMYEVARENGAQGIGLFRSESLIRQPGTIPSEDEQFDAYCKIADAAGVDSVRIRTFDVGIARFGSDPHWIERNPALGLRAIRLSLADPRYFRAQIRAILRASFRRKIDLILPMISGVDEITRAENIIDEERSALIKAGIDIGTPRLGAMIETPSAVLIASEIATRVDFLCLGTNDLVQYLLAVDRDNDAVADWYQSLHPAVMRAISQVLVAAENVGISVTVCGEMAGSPFYAPVLLGLGARELSMNINSIAPVQHLLSGISLSDAIALADSAAKYVTSEEIEDHLHKYYVENWAALFPSDFLRSRFR